VSAMEVRLVVLDGVHKDREIPLPETIFLIGRDRQCHLRPHCQGVSKLHCAIAAWAGKVRVRDLKSRNGTYVNGRRVHGEVAVEDGDQLQVGSLVFGFRIKNAGSALLAAPIKDKREVEWLLNDDGDSAVLSPSNRTSVIAGERQPAASAETELELAIEEDDSTPGSKNISAGHHFRSYFALQKRWA
jgi:pSer/pThr/pTyr-binding forkhead associated (FHA) protein